MAAAVFRSLQENRSLLVEAGTGIGKTLAYLVPALLSGRRVVVSTGTRTLQDQIVHHDLPLLQELLPTPFEAVALKGVSNYLCRRRLAELQALDRPPDTLGADTLEELVAWSRDTLTGDRAEVVELAENAPIWRLLTQTPETRLGPRCPFYDHCFVTRARQRAENADLVLVNHHLFFADLALRAAYPGARVLPDYDAVIFDEAHQLEDVLTEHFGVRVSTAGVTQLCHDARHALIGRAELFARAALFDHEMSVRVIAGVERSAARFFAALGQYIGARRADERERVALSAELFAESAREDAWLQLDGALHELAALSRDIARERAPDERTEHGERAEAALAVARRASLVRADLLALARRSDDSFAYWGEARGPGVTLRGAPIDVGQYLRKYLLGDTPAAIFTSATLTCGQTFAYVRERLGLDAEMADELAIDSPFDYARQAFLYIPRDLPDPRAPAWLAAACARMAELAELTDGRGFLLFTSHRALHAAAKRLARATDFHLLVQGHKPKQQLLRAFQSTPRSLLLGTSSFWQGVDVPGRALSLVVMDKLPFSPPDDPLLAARMRQYEQAERDPFTELQVPRAALALEQGFGRLIRRRDDRGIVAVLDHRLLSRRYGQAFLATLPQALRRTSSLEQVRRFWQGTGETAP